jgi:citrate synthase
MATETNDGLEGVIVAATRLSDVDGEKGRLVVAGHDVEELAGRLSFEGLCGLLWRGELPADGGRGLQEALGAARVRAFARVEGLRPALLLADPMDALRASVAQLSEATPEAVTGAVAVLAAAATRLHAGEAPIAPDASLGHAADYLRMATGRAPDAARDRGIEAYLVTVADHGMNASTFTARVIASTGSDLVSAVTGAIGALKGPLHGGAPGPVLDMLDAIGTPDNATGWLDAELGSGRRIMGMGHRVYRVRDPRAAVLEKATLALEKAGFATGRLALARAVEQAALGALQTRYPARSLCANVEFYTAVLLDTLGLPRQVFAPTFAVGRVAGWAAHFAEQKATGRLIRPASRYVGAMPLMSRPRSASPGGSRGAPSSGRGGRRRWRSAGPRSAPPSARRRTGPRRRS